MKAILAWLILILIVMEAEPSGFQRRLVNGQENEGHRNPPVTGKAVPSPSPTKVNQPAKPPLPRLPLALDKMTDEHLKRWIDSLLGEQKERLRLENIFAQACVDIKNEQPVHLTSVTLGRVPVDLRMFLEQSLKKPLDTARLSQADCLSLTNLMANAGFALMPLIDDATHELYQRIK